MEAGPVLIDTNVFIEHIRAASKENTLLARLHDSRMRLLTSTIVVAELAYGARSRGMRSTVEDVLAPVTTIPFTADAAMRISIEAEQLRKRNALIGFRDLAIASVALTCDVPIVTHNQREFRCISALHLIDLSAFQ